MAGEYCQSYLGTVQRVLLETDTQGEKDGLTDTYIRVYTNDEAELGEIYNVRLERLYKDGIYGTIINTAD